MSEKTAGAASTSPFNDLDEYVALPRLSGLALSLDGTRLVTGVTTLNPKRTKYVTALWEVDPTGERPARRLTRSAKGESGARFTPDGSLLFVSARPDPEAEEPDDDEAPAALWSLPAGGGEAEVVATRPGGVERVVVARGSGAVVLASKTLPSSDSAEDDEQRRKERKDHKVAAILHESYPVRWWDHDLGPDSRRLLIGASTSDRSTDPDGSLELRDLTGHVGHAVHDEAEWDVTPDGAVVVTVWTVPEPGGSERESLMVIDAASGERRVLADDRDYEFTHPRISPDGASVACIRVLRTSPDNPGDSQLVVLPVGGGALSEVAPDWDRWPTSFVWTPDGAALIVTADDGGRAPLFRVDVATGAVTALSVDHGSYSDPQVSPDGAYVYALRAAVDAPPAPVRLEAAAPGQQPAFLPAPGAAPALPGRLTEVTTTATDGTPLRGWLALPEGADQASPAPLLLWIHGGPLGSWNSWSWRWNPWLAVAQGYAVLLPDPALSTGYGLDFIRRGWGRWGEAPYTDTMAVTDAAVARPDIDASRTAAMGGSFGGYMANWVAGHTDRFRGIVTHASLWALDQFGPTTDAYFYWRREMTPEMSTAYSPHRFVREIRTPMLVIHGDRDYRVPIGEALRLWAELTERHDGGEGIPHKFLYFPDENHWILTPQHAKVWYETVFAFLATTVHDQPWQVPDILR